MNRLRRRRVIKLITSIGSGAPQRASCGSQDSCETSWGQEKFPGPAQRFIRDSTSVRRALPTVRMKDYLVLIGQELGEEGRIARDEAKGRGRGQRAQAKGIWLKILFLISVEGRNQGMTDWLVF